MAIAGDKLGSPLATDEIARLLEDVESLLAWLNVGTKPSLLEKISINRIKELGNQYLELETLQGTHLYYENLPTMKSLICQFGLREGYYLPNLKH